LFFDNYRIYFGKLTQRMVDALNFFNKKVIEQQKRFTLEEWAYIYATVIWETGYTFECVKEGLNKSEEWRKKHLRYFPYYGRGYVQLTWPRNYEQFGKRLKLDLLSKPDLALVPEIAFKILCDGCEHGLYTGIKLKGIDFKKTYTLKNGNKQLGALYARRVINSTDKAKEIAEIHTKFINILQKSLYKVIKVD
jgi:hypothetical protein